LTGTFVVAASWHGQALENAMKGMSVVLVAVLSGLPIGLQARAAEALHPLAGRGCTDLVAAQLGEDVGAQTTISSSEEKSLEGGRYCVVEGTIAPAIRFEARLPVQGWSGRYLQTGCGGLCGTLAIRVEHADSCVPVRNHAVVLASTDMGHEGMGGDWAVRNPATRADFGHRGVHLTALAVKALIRAYYGRPARFAYFSGCSDGGREALIEAQRYPQDFDGIAAGAPALNFTVQNSFYHAWNAVSNTAADGRAIVTSAQLPRLHAAVLAGCDALDGTVDGVIEDPRACHFDPATLACSAGQAPDQCLTDAQVVAASRFYQGARDAQGRRLVPGGPMPGSELAWEGVFVPRPGTEAIFSKVIVEGSVPALYYDTPLANGWSVSDLKFDKATLDSFRLRGLYDATDPDLSGFERRGGKLLMWHGWSDPHISPINSISYYNAVADRMGRQRTQAFARLFVVPGLYHCSGGEGATEFDVVGALMDWVERHKVPAVLDVHGGSTHRPVYAYPDSAKRTAQGTWKRAKGAFDAHPVDWLGAAFSSPLSSTK
jgi:feruloyl esterase